MSANPQTMMTIVMTKIVSPTRPATRSTRRITSVSFMFFMYILRFKLTDFLRNCPESSASLSDLSSASSMKSPRLTIFSTEEEKNTHQQMEVNISANKKSNVNVTIKQTYEDCPASGS